MSIHVILGEPGAGKTTLAAILAMEALKRGGRDVATNFPMTDDRVEYFETWEAMQTLSNATAFLDEAAQWFSRRAWQKNTDGDLVYWRQHRKDGLTLYMLAHGMADLESKIVGELASTVWHVQRLFGPNEDEGPTFLEKHIGMWAVATRYQAREYELSSKRKIIGRRHFRIDKNYHLFDSSFVVGGRDGGGRKGASSSLRVVTQQVADRHPLVSPDLYDEMREEVFAGSIVRIKPRRVLGLFPGLPTDLEREPAARPRESSAPTERRVSR